MWFEKKKSSDNQGAQILLQSPPPPGFALVLDSYQLSNILIRIDFAAADLEKRGREDRQILNFKKEGGSPGKCLTSKGEVGQCTTFKECYPYFKIPDLGVLDGWVLGVYDSCSYLRSDGLPAFGICCADYQPTSPLPDIEEEVPVENPDEVRIFDNKLRINLTEIRRKYKNKDSSEFHQFQTCVSK